MPKRTDEHRTGDIAADEVRRIWTIIGAAVESVFKDYGEDLCVQTSLGNELDDSRIWIQVKGTRDISRFWRPKAQAFVVSVRNDLLARWSRFADEVVLVLWDVKDSKGWYALPQEQVDDLELLTFPKRESRVRVSPSNVFDTNAATFLASCARAHSVGRLYDLLDARMSRAREFGEDQELERYKQQQFALLMKWLLDSKIMVRYDNRGLVRFAPEFTKEFSEQLAVRASDSVDDLFQPIFDAIVNLIAPGVIHEGVLAAAVHYLEAGMLSKPRYEMRGAVLGEYPMTPPDGF